MLTSQQTKQNTTIRYLLVIGIIIFLNIISTAFFHRWDLSSEKRFTLSQPTKKLLRELNNEVYVKVYLDGEFPPGFQRLQKSIEETLNEFKLYAGKNLQYEFINPADQPDEKSRNEYYAMLTKKGIAPKNLQVKDDENYSEQYVFPGALVSYLGQEWPVNFLQDQIGMDPQVALNGSVAMVEYKLANIISKLKIKDKPKIAFTEGNGELSEILVKDIADAESEFYEMHRINLNEGTNIDTTYKTLVIARPTEPFTEQEKWKLDQYVMYGGNILWIIEPVIADMDSMQSGQTKDTIGGESFVTSDLPLQLDDLLFQYGVRFNTDLIQDQQCNYIPIVIGMKNNTPQTKNFPWVYYPLISPESKHPTVKNLDLVLTQFASSIDTVKTNNNINKQVLLSSSQYSRSLFSPVAVSLRILQDPPNAKQFNKKNIPIAVLSEGKFESLYKNRLSTSTQSMLDTLSALPILNESKGSKQIFLSDAALIKNEAKGDRIAPLGYYKFTNQTFANKDFIINCIEYLTDDNGMIESRAKDVKLRLLDKAKCKSYRVTFQLITLLIPLAILVLIGIIWNIARQKKFGI